MPHKMLFQKNKTAFYQSTMEKKRIILKDKKLKERIKKEGRKGAKRDFLELLRRSARTITYS